ncbi:MAG TPA: cupin domain-containing protein [Anaeromyxobacteraceae bacterium]|nr:cupin domain-containing protein [Anaeromyxobacteraceae bacterium]
MSARFDAVEWIARTDDVAVRVNTLGPGQSTPWHFHSVVTDNVFALDPGIEVSLRGPDEGLALAPGARREIPPSRVHRVSNRSDRPARYLLVQATGRYDFVEVP